MNFRIQKRAALHRRLFVQTLEDRHLLAGDVGMTNTENPYDVNGDQIVSASDALGVINMLNRFNNLAEAETVDAGEMMPDTNGDGDVTPGDALGVINVLAVQGEVHDHDHDGDHEDHDHDDEDQPEAVIRKFRVHQGSTTYIEFEGDYVTGEVEVMDDGSVRLSGAGLEETISVDTPNVLKLRVTGHHNLLVVSGLQVKDDLILDVDGNQNHFALMDSYVGDDLIYLGAEGVDRVLVEGTTIMDDFEFHGRKLDDVLVVRNSSIGDDFYFHGHRGHDLLFADQVTVGDNAVVRMGDGDDIGAIQNVSVRDRADVDAQGDYDLMAIGVQDFTADELKVRGFEGETSFADIEASIDAFLADTLDRLAGDEGDEVLA